jgi:hypothetical protein
MALLMQAHDKGLRAVKFSHNGSFLFTCDDTGTVGVAMRSLLGSVYYLTS